MKLAKEVIKYIGKPETMGEVWNLEKIKILENTIEPKTELEKLITDFFFGDMVNNIIENNGNFITVELEKKYLKKLNSMLNAKTEETKLKRQKNIMNEFTRWKYNVMFCDNIKLNQIYEHIK